MTEKIIQTERTRPILVSIVVAACVLFFGCCPTDTECAPSVRVVKDSDGGQQFVDHQSGFSVEHVFLIGCKSSLEQITDSSMDEIWLYFRQLLRENPEQMARLERGEEPNLDARHSICLDLNEIVGSEAVKDIVVAGFYMYPDNVFLPSDSDAAPGDIE